MSRSPFLPPSRRRSREAARRRRRRQRRRVLAAIASLAIVAALAYVVLAHGATTSHAHPGASSARERRTAGGGVRSASSAAPTHVDRPLSPAGLPLGRPPLARLRVASLTKMMTALLTVKSTTPDARVLITKQAEETSGSKVGVLPLGRRVPLEPLLYGLLLPSGNDAAVALAQHVAGTVHRFVEEMNEEAARLGLGCTHYSSPSGYYNTHNYSCALDLAELAGIDLHQPRIARVTRTRAAILPFPIKGGKLYLYNNNPLLIYGYPGTTGMKTGETIEAGRCLVATAERRGVRLAVVLLHSPDPGTQARDLLNDAFQNVYHLPAVPEPPMPSGA